MIPLRKLRRPRRLLAAAAIAAVAALATAGCSATITSQPDPTIGDDTLLVAGDAGSPNYERNFNPYLGSSRAGVDYIYEPLLMSNPIDGDLTPWLAEDFSQPDPETIEMTIRDDATWQDGEPLTVEDVAFTFDMLKEFPATDINGAWSRIDSFDVDDDANSITFHLAGEDSPALWVVGRTIIVPEHIWKDVDDPATWRDENPVGSGPYELGNFTPLQYSMDAWSGHWMADQIEVKHIVFPASNTQIDLVTRGFDWAYAYMSDVDGTWGAANPDNHYWFPPGGIIGLQMNLEKAPFDDVDVRRGLSLALDKEKISDVAVEGLMDPASQTGLLLPNLEDELDPSIPNEGVIDQDTDAAIASFEDAGFSYDGTTMTKPDGSPFSFTMLVANGYTDYLRAAQEVQRELGAIGIEVKIQSPQPASLEASMNSGDFEVAMNSSNGAGSLYDAYNSLLSSDFYQPTGTDTQNNRIRYQDADTDALLDELRAATTDDEKTAVTQQLEQVFYDQVPVVALYYGGLWGLYNDGRFTGWPDADDPYAPLNTWDASALNVVVHLKQAKGSDQ
ncbi:ABC transporter substrate-binding protein [Microbacterium indicum]|uniref:ABC transporter substrate-binding protein n=1 Tax=Microbacterium indicum TaxID=358100 RepID=UPI000417208D|nr:ABC transporter substrate-binding protein [Microbacterium indicum]